MSMPLLTMPLRRLLPLILSWAIFLSSLSIALSYRLYGSLEDVFVAEVVRFQSLALAEELRQSSVDLTRFARIYVATGDEKFLKIFQDILDIRNGIQPRPMDYDRSYWDRLIGENLLPTQKTGEKISLTDRMKDLHFSDKEFALLATAQKNSDALALIENRAFAALKGGTGENPDLTTAPNPDLARKLLHDQAYLDAKAKILFPIDEFRASVNTRTSEYLEQVRNNAKFWLLGLFISAIALLATLFGFTLLINRRVLVRLGALERASQSITEGDLSARSHVLGKDELGKLGLTFDGMVARLTETLAIIKEANARMEEELNVGRDIQMSMLPLTFPPFPDRKEFSIYAELHPAREVGGDFYDFFFLDEHRLCFCVGDVSGKGVPAALFMAVTRTLLRAIATADLSVAEIITRVNNKVSSDNPTHMFVTVFLGVLDVRTGICQYSSGGHPPPLHYSKGQAKFVEKIQGPALGIIENSDYGEGTLVLGAGDYLLAYTDGVTEAESASGEFQGEERLRKVLQGNVSNEVKSLTELVVKSTAAFEEGTDQSDDVTVLALRFGRTA